MPGFTPETETLLAQADRLCAGRGARLTELRRHVLGLILQSPRPAGAYDLLAQLRPDARGAAPPTIYRALDFLLEQGLIHKVERLAAFIGCVHADGTGPGQPHTPHAAQFLVCTTCGRAAELNDPALAHALTHAAETTGFSVAAATIEATGTCRDCARAG